MDYKICFRRFVALFLCCLLALYTPLFPIAHATDPVTATTIAVTGSQLATGGLSGASAAAALGPPAAAIVGLTLGALGVGTYVSKKAADAGVTPTSYVMTQIAYYCVKAKMTEEQFYKTVLDGASVAADGTIALANSAAKAIQQFGSWAFTEEGVVVPDVSSGSTTATLGNYTLLPLPARAQSPLYPATYSGDSRCTQISMQVDATQCYACILGTTLCLFSNWKITNYWNAALKYYDSSGDNYGVASGMTKTAICNGLYWSTFSGIVCPSIPTYNVSLEQFQNDVQGKSVSIVQNPAADQVFVGDADTWAENKDLLNPSKDDTPAAVLNPDVLNPIIDQLAEGTQWQMGITDYLKALEAAFDQAITGINDKLVSLTDVVTGISKDVAVPDTATKEKSISRTDTKEDDTPVVNPEEIDTDEAIAGLSFALDEVFPFCLPFDVYKMLSLLSADPVAPRYHVHYEGPYNIVIDFTVDLSAWNDVAAICRNMELLLFCVGLAVATRSIFIRA